MSDEQRVRIDINESQRMDENVIVSTLTFRNLGELFGLSFQMAL